MTLPKEYLVILLLCALTTILLTSLEVSYILSIQDYLSAANEFPATFEANNHLHDFGKENQQIEQVEGAQTQEKISSVMNQELAESKSSLKHFVFILHLPKVNLNQKSTQEKASLAHLQQISELEDKISAVNFEILIQPDFIPYDAYSLKTLFHLGKKYGLKFEDMERLSKISLRTIAKYIKRLHFYESSKGLIERNNKVSCIVSIPSADKVKNLDIDDIVSNSCNEETKVFTDINEVYTLNPSSGGIEVINEHLQFVQENTAALFFSSFSFERYVSEFSLDSSVSALLSITPTQMQWNFHQVLNNNDKYLELGRNSEKLSRILNRNAFVKDIDLELLVCCWNNFNPQNEVTKIVFIVNEKTHTINTNGLELSNKDVIQFTVENF